MIQVVNDFEINQNKYVKLNYKKKKYFIKYFLRNFYFFE